VETGPIRYHAAASLPDGTPVFAWAHDDELEIVWADERGHWAREYKGPMDPADIGLDVDDAGRVRACFFRSGQLIVY
jgi:hypothetical protein